MHPADIKASLSKKGIKQVVLADQLGVFPSAIHRVINGKTRSRRIAVAIANATGKQINRLWPGVYEKRSKQ